MILMHLVEMRGEKIAAALQSAPPIAKVVSLDENHWAVLCEQFLRTSQSLNLGTLDVHLYKIHRSAARGLPPFVERDRGDGFGKRERSRQGGIYPENSAYSAI
jgi:hypothetical protein